MNDTERQQIEHFSLFGEVYDTLEACSEVERSLGRLKRQRLMTEDDWAECKRQMEGIRERIERYTHSSDFSPKAPRIG